MAKFNLVNTDGYFGSFGNIFRHLSTETVQSGGTSGANGYVFIRGDASSFVDPTAALVGGNGGNDSVWGGGGQWRLYGHVPQIPCWLIST